MRQSPLAVLCICPVFSAKSVFLNLAIRFARVQDSKPETVSIASELKLCLISLMSVVSTCGCTRFVNRIKTRREAGSIHRLPPVNPLCPMPVGGNEGPAEQPGVSASIQPIDRDVSHPRVRLSLNQCSDSGFNSSLPARNCFAIRNTSRAVENNPACPATPSMKCALPSCTSPQMTSVRHGSRRGDADSGGPGTDTGSDELWKFPGDESSRIAPLSPRVLT